MDRRNRRKKKREKQKSTLADEVFAIMQASLKSALDAALDDLLKSWK